MAGLVAALPRIIIHLLIFTLIYDLINVQTEEVYLSGETAD